MKKPFADLNIISITPQLPPKINGLGDQAWLLAAELKRKYNANTVFLNADPDINRSYASNEENISINTSKPFLHVLKDYNASYIVLHYVGYGYSPSGCPGWLIDGLKKYKVISPGCTIVTIFYELYASGKLWQKSFWTQFYQKKLVYDLLELSDYSITNTDITYNILKSKASHKQVNLIPVYSNLGEPQNLPLFSQRNNSLVIFGSAAVREKILKNSYDSLLYWLEKLKIESIIEIGPSRNKALDMVGNIPIINEGILSLEKASEKLLENKFCMLHYPVGLLSKSSVFSSYASHGIVPIIVDDNLKKHLKEANGLRDGIHYLHAHNLSQDFENISKDLYEWYQEHTIEKTASKIYKMLLDK